MLLNRLVNSANFLNFSTVVSSPYNSSKFYCTSNNSGEEIIDEATVYLQNRNSRGQPNNVGNHNIGAYNRAFHPPNRYPQQQAQRFRPTGGGYQYQQQYSRPQQNQIPTNIQPQRRQQNWQPLQRMQMKPQPPPAMNQSPVYNQMNIQPQPQKSQSDTLADLMMQQKIDNLQNNIMQMMQMQLQNQMFQQQSQAQIGGVSQVLSQQLVNFMLQSHMNQQQQQLPALSPPSTPVQSTPVPQQSMDKNQMATSLISQWLNSRMPTQKPQMAKSYDYVGEENIHQQNVQQQPQQYQQYRPPLQPRQGGPPQKFTRMILNQSPREHQMQSTGSSVVKQTQIAMRNEYIEEQEDFEELPFRPKKQLENPKEEEEENVAATSTNSEKEEENGDNKNEEENDKSMGSAFLSGKMEASGSN